MAEAHLFESQDEFTCSVCLDTVTDPITNPCGHSFCLKCHTDCWDQSQLFSCPQCREKFKKTGLRSPPSQKYAAVKSCLTCPEKLCVKHQKSLEMFCETDDACICTMCGVTEHNGHKMVKLEMEREYKEVSGTSKRVGRVGNERSRSLIQSHRKGLMCLVSAAPDWFLLIVCVVLRPQSQTSSLVFFSLLSDFCPLTLDINTAHRCLHLSEGNKKVTYEGTRAKYPDHPDRFNCCVQVLCREALTGTRCYWEVECTGESLKIGVTYKGMSRKGWGLDCCLGYNDKSWCLWCYDSQYSVHHNHQRTVISAPYSPRIGVYLDWPAGSLSFYSVSHTMILLHRFNTSFTEPLYPGLYICHSWYPESSNIFTK
uniref:Tripartite motif-containing protein 16-like n=1 Tax=Erpetoichthys calabaricus TaxID=27687 RepID=A0A8C4X4D2_ERPCA